MQRIIFDFMNSDLLRCVRVTFIKLITRRRSNPPSLPAITYYYLTLLLLLGTHQCYPLFKYGDAVAMMAHFSDS